MLHAEEVISSTVYIWILVSCPAHPAVSWGPPIRLGVHHVPASHASLGATVPDHTPAAYKQPVCSSSSSFRQPVSSSGILGPVLRFLLSCIWLTRWSVG